MTDQSRLLRPNASHPGCQRQFGTSRLVSCIAATFLLLAIPATAQNITLEDDAGRTRRCQEVVNPKRLPSVDALIDSAAFAAAIEAASLDEESGALLGLLFDPSGTLTSIRQLEPAAPQQVAWFSALSPLVRSQQAGKTPWAVRLRISGGTRPTSSIERSVYCPPEIASRSGPVRLTGMAQISSGDRPPQRGQRMKIEVELTVSADGDVTRVDVLRSSGVADLDAEIVRHHQALRYLPGLVDGLAIPRQIRPGKPSRF